MYEAVDDPYCYPGTTVLRNKLGIRDDALEEFEEEMTRERAAEPLPAGDLSVRHYQAIHRHLFQDVYRWVGRFRTIRISKATSTFAFPEHVPTQMQRVFGELRDRHFLRGLDAKAFAAGAAHLLADLNAIHPFRDGNGRTQLVLIGLVAAEAAHPLDFEQLDPGGFLAAMITSFRGDEDPLAAQILRLIRKGPSR